MTLSVMSTDLRKAMATILGVDTEDIKSVKPVAYDVEVEAEQFRSYHRVESSLQLTDKRPRWHFWSSDDDKDS